MGEKTGSKYTFTIDESVASIQMNIDAATAMIEKGDYNFHNLPDRLRNKEGAEEYLKGLEEIRDALTKKEARTRGMLWGFACALEAAKSELGF